jgi:hypothetical protein
VITITDGYERLIIRRSSRTLEIAISTDDRPDVENLEYFDRFAVRMNLARARQLRDELNELLGES